MSIGEVATRTGLSVHALRFYEREGLLAFPVRREPNGCRAYSEDDVEWLMICVNFRSSGMSLDALRRYVTLVRQGEGNEEERLSILHQHRHYIAEQLTQLAACLKVIDYKVDVYKRQLAEERQALFGASQVTTVNPLFQRIDGVVGVRELPALRSSDHSLRCFDPVTQRRAG